MAQHDTTGRHLRAVPDQPTDDDIPLGVTWQADPDERDPREKRGAPASEPLPPLQGRVVDTAEHNGALSPARISAAEITDKLKAHLEAGHTYALLAWTRRWEVAMGYVMDPALREQMLDEAEEELDAKRASAAKAARRAISPEDQVKAKRRADRLQRREVSELEVDARVLRARTARLVGKVAIPAAVIVGPVLLAATGTWVGLLIWPAAWGWLAVQGRAHARAELGTSAAETAPFKHKARQVVTTTAHTAAPTPTPTPAAGEVVGATGAENRLLALLAGWDEHTEGRGLDGVAPSAPTIDPLGIRVVLTTSGRVTPKSLEKKLPAIRACLSVPREVRTDLSEGDYGDQAVLRIRTRTPSRDMVWRPGCQGIGVDTDTGQPVVLPKGRMLFAGTSGAGKSVMVRVAIAEALTAEEPTVVVFIDAKGEESALWRGKIRIANTPEHIQTLLIELNRESEDRSQIMQEQGVANWTPTQERPRIVAFVDEGAELIDMHDVSAKDPEDRMDLLSWVGPLGRLGRSRAIDIKWGTQKPTVGEGIPSQLSGVMQDRVVLKTAGRNENNQVLGADWKSHELELGGFAVTNIAGRGPNQAPIQVWDLHKDSHITNVPGGAVWSYRPRGGERGPVSDDAEEWVAEEGEDWIGAQGAVMAALKERGPRTLAQLESDLDYSKTMVYKALKQLEAASRIAQGSGRGSAWRAL